jgi:1-acyl-sn-glycerol-3-phosphate acyltransferase
MGLIGSDIAFTYLRRSFVTLWFWLGVAVGTLVTSIIVAAVFIVRRNLVNHDFITLLIEDVMASIIYMWMTIPGIWKLTTYHLEGMKDEDTTADKGPFILASNHNSFVDTLFIALMNHRKTYTYNYKYRYAPLFGQLCWLAGYIGIRSGVSSTPEIVKRVRAGYSIMIYPEGTRNKNPKVGVVAATLRTGAFVVSSQTGCSILPIKMVGTDEIVMPYWIADVGEVKLITCRPYKVATEFDPEEEKTRYANIINSCPTDE